METEIKFYVHHLDALRKQVVSSGAVLLHQRVHEMNLRFDTPDQRLTNAHRLVRLRKDTKIRITYKDKAETHQKVSKRREIEFEVDDFDAAKAFLMALGYTTVTIYEKYRTTYGLGDVVIMLDEMPYGNFIEIEGADAAAIKSTADTLALDWDAGVPDSYYALFMHLKEKHDLSMHDITFESFDGMTFSPDDFSIMAGDAG